jgi:hypothetical protein
VTLVIALLVVETALVSSWHPEFARAGGFRHLYANRQAAAGVTSPTKQRFECHCGPGTRDSVFSKRGE